MTKADNDFPRHDRRVASQDRRAVGQMLLQHLKFLQSIIDNVPEPILVISPARHVLLLNQAARDFPGRPLADEKIAQTSHCHRVLFGRDESCETAGDFCPLKEVLETGKTVKSEHEIIMPDGGKRSYEILASPFWNEAGELTGVIEALRDVTESRRAAVVLRESREKLEQRVAERTNELLAANEKLCHEVEDRRWAEDQLIEAIEHAQLVYRVIPSAIFTVDLDRNITSWNNKAERITGYSRAEVLGKPCSVFALKPCTTGCGVFSEKVPKPIMDRECEIRTKEGEIRVIAKNADLLRDASGRIIGGVESFGDITGRKKVDSQLRTERDKFHGMLSAMGHGMHILNRDFAIEYQNEVLRRQFGDKLGEKCYQVYKQRDNPCEVCRMHAAIESNTVQRTEETMTNNRYYEQTYAPFRDVDGEVKALILLRDITEEKKLAADTMRAGQLASIGELAAGVAHEINNPINGIINYAQVLLDRPRGEGGAEEVLQRIIKEGERIAGIVSNLLAFARQRSEDIETLPVALVIDDALALFIHQLQKDGISLTMDIAGNLPLVRVNPQQLQQVFLNLLSNARHALNQRYQGKHAEKQLIIRCRLVKVGKQRFVRTEFTDHGTGIAKEIAEHIFDPFFSSKKPGEGTGLGLSISHGIITDFNGRLHAESEEGRYTTMAVDLPPA